MTTCEKHDDAVIILDKGPWGKCQLCEAEEKIKQQESELETANSEIEELQNQLEETK